MSYSDFLDRKRRVARDVGPTIEPSDLHPALFGWQAEIVSWALRKGRAALFEDCGLGKTVQQLEWARHAAATSLILAPLSVARQTVREAHRLGLDVRYVRDGADVVGPGVWVTNYEMADRFDPATFGAVVLDESSILKNVAGRTRQKLTAQLASVDRRLACTATPAPNDVTELCNHAEFLGHMHRGEMLAHYFVNDEFHGRSRWRLKGHAQDRFYEWMATWAVGVRRPSDLGWPDDGYDLPPLRIHGEIVDVELPPAEGQLFAALGGVSGRAQIRRLTISARVERVIELVDTHATRYDYGYEHYSGAAGLQPAMAGGEPGSGDRIPGGDQGQAQRSEARAVLDGGRPTSQGTPGRSDLADSEPGQAQESSAQTARHHTGNVSGDAGGPSRQVRDLRSRRHIDTELLPSGGSLSFDGTSERSALHAVQSGSREVQGRPETAGIRHPIPESWVIWCGLNEEQDALAKAFGDRAFSIHGSLSPDEKEERLLAWLDGERPILLSKPSICGFGLNLQRAHKMAFVGLSDSYEAYYQAIRRCWRFGQQHPVDVHIVVSELEQEIVANVRSKEAEASMAAAGLVKYSELRRSPIPA